MALKNPVGKRIKSFKNKLTTFMRNTEKGERGHKRYIESFKSCYEQKYQKEKF